MENKKYNSILLSMKLEELIRVPSSDFIGYFWKDKNGNYTQDEKKLVEKEAVKIPQTKYAESIDDYIFILKRESEKKGQSIDDYAEILIEDLKTMLQENIAEYGKLNIDLTDKRIRVKKFIKYLESRQAPPLQSFNYRIFTSKKGQAIFDEWQELHKDNYSTHLADYSFIFRALEKDGFIQFGIRGTQFIDFLEDYNISIGKLKTFNKCNTTKRINLYNTIKIAKR